MIEYSESDKGYIFQIRFNVPFTKGIFSFYISKYDKAKPFYTMFGKSNQGSSLFYKDFWLLINKFEIVIGLYEVN